MALLPIPDARAMILADITAPRSETVPLRAGLGRVLAGPVTAARDQPPFPASAMDGYAVRAAEATAGARLRIAGASVAGRRFAGALPPGEAVRIFTGAPVPPGADTVLIQENTERDGDVVIVREPVAAGRNIRAAGIDFAAGDTLLVAGDLLSPRALGLAAALGAAEVAVARRPRVAVLATGDELVPVGGTPGPDQIIASSTVALAALIETHGAEALDLGIATDDEASLRTAVAAAREAQADVLVTLGGASVGEHDLVRQALAAEGVALDFWKIAIRPGKPMMFGRSGGLRVLGLPGNPVSTHVCAHLFLLPLIRALLGCPEPGPMLEPARLGCDVAANDVREDYLRATLAVTEAGLVATPFPMQDSSMMRPLASAGCLLVRPAHAPAAHTGDPCRIIRLDEQG